MKYLRKLLEDYPQECIVLEGLILTHDIGSSISIIQTTFRNIQVGRPRETPNTIWVSWSARDQISDYDKFLQVITNLGWFISYIRVDAATGEKYNESVINRLLQTKQYKRIQLDLEAKYDIRVDNRRIPKTLYHGTQKKYIERIMRQGLTPRSQEKRAAHPERIYLADTLEHTEIFLQHSGIPRNEQVILKINSFRLKENFKLMIDPNFPFGFYTLNTIPPFAL